MSGGVDSTVAAHLLQEQGYDVTGATMRLWVDNGVEPGVDRNGSRKACPEMEALDRARSAAEMLGIDHRVYDLREEFYRKVVCNFTGEYLQGKTPNPCVECNRTIKFGSLIELARREGFKLVASGHYARIVTDPATGHYKLFKGEDRGKDQSYMLYVLGQEQLSSLLLPLGKKVKREVRTIAKSLGLDVNNLEESQDICFIPGNDYQLFLERFSPRSVQPGAIVSTSGEILGRHRGIAFYTVGQRKGLGITASTPLYVVRIDAQRNRVVVGTEEETFSSGLNVRRLNFVGGEEPESPLNVEVKIRYRSPAVKAILVPLQHEWARVDFETAQKAVAPGQSAVFYRGDEVIGGGIIV